MEFQSEGDLSDKMVHDLVYKIYRKGLNGILMLSQGKKKKTIFFKEGRPVDARSNLVSECLANVALKSGKISREVLDGSPELIKLEDNKQGIKLMEMGILSPQDLKEMLGEQIKIKISETFTWTDGSYRFYEREVTPPTEVKLNISPINLILDGIKTYFSFDRIRHLLDKDINRYLIPREDPPHQFDELNLSSDDKTLTSLVNGKTTLKETISKSPLDPQKSYKILFALLLLEIFDLKDEPVLNGEKGKSPEAVYPEDRPEDKELIEKLNSILSNFVDKNYFEILGVGLNSSADEIKNSYFHLAREYHPDRLGRVSVEVKKKADEVFVIITSAYHTLSDHPSREEYLSSLTADSSAGIKGYDVNNIVNAEMQFEKARTLVNRGSFKEALKPLQWAVELNPNEAEYWVYLGWSHFKSRPGDRKKGKDYILKAINMNPKVDSAYLFLGYILKSEGDKKKAEAQFKRAIQCNSDNYDARRELDRIRTIKKKGEGLFGRLKDKISR